MEFSASKIADFLQGSLEGDADVRVSQIAKIEEATKGTLTFLANPAYTSYIYTTNASIVLVREDFLPEKPIGSTLIRVKDPYGALARLLELYKSNIPEKAGISELAFISPTAEVGENAYIGEFAYIGDKVKMGKNVKVYPHCYIGDNVHIGDDTILYSGVRIYEQSQIGRDCTLHANAVIGADGFGFAPQTDNNYKKVAQIGNVVIEDNVEIGAGTTIDRATLGSTVIKKGVKLDNLIQIGHNVVVGENTVMAAQCGVAGSSKIGKNCMIGGQVGISGHLTIGDNVKMAAQCGVPSNVKDGQIIMGSPAMEASQYRKSFIYFRNFEKLVKRIDELEKEIQRLTKA
ncbi:MAG: UDP-3-O-(3-hydroxymyristoyl)glucosamine N-acyltransferase [Bacteroidia bacterium]|nr:MAG: UDP-3-O-(3-hydroxymyristoyl)glucosamine N-acyltransferase [Bacteroidia bacterium]